MPAHRHPRSRTTGSTPSAPDGPAGPDRSRIARGRWGEDVAARHYERLGFRVLDRNWRCRDGEIDLILEHGRLLVFCEVKARRSGRHGPAAAAVTPTKQARIRRLASTWLREHPGPRRTVRFDVFAITGSDVRLIESAF